MYIEDEYTELKIELTKDIKKEQITKLAIQVICLKKYISNYL